MQYKRAILEKLLEGPATVRELSEMLGWQRRKTQVRVWSLQRYGGAVRARRVVRVEKARGELGPRSYKLFEITMRGKGWLRVRVKQD